MSDCVIRTGDIVHHEPTGEDWTVAYVDGDYLAWCGWPEGEAKVSDCWLKKSGTDEEHIKLLREIAQSSGKRGRHAKLALETLDAAKEATTKEITPTQQVQTVTRNTLS